MGNKIVHINNPSVNNVQQLENQGYSLTCPYTTLSINYEYLFQLEPVYHHICLSAFVSTDWIKYLNKIDSNSDDNFDNRNFHETIHQLITNELLQFDLYINQINSSIEQFKSTLSNTLLRQLQLIRNIINLNEFISGGYSNCTVEYYTDEQSTMVMATLKTDVFNLLSNGCYSKYL
ncbi:unnamed protein product [Rotaria sp. Silwood2]|nr:unnamed protein product [Rotaria sp. Silwood2]CAF4406743.1 unnamed protein product [Rotaria sp. Silwood2]